MKRALFLADVIAPSGDDNKRQISDFVQYRGTEYLNVALGFVPHATLLGPTLLGTILERAGYAVEILECAFRPQQRRNLHAALAAAPDYVLLTTTFIESVNAVQEVVKIIRKLSPRSIVILGGPSLLSEMDMRKLGDFAVIGEGERALPELLRRLDHGESPTGIPGVCYFDEKGMNFTQPSLLPSLDELPFPNWNLVRREPGEYYSIATQRGCFWRCAFCSYPANEGYKLRYFSVDRILAEMKHNYEKFGIRRYVFADSTFTHPPDRCTELLSKICELPFPIEWVAYARVDTITPAMADVIRKSGCQGIFFGCDSGDEEILKKMNKRFTVTEIRRGVSLLQSAGVPVTASWIVGFPGETPQSVRNTLDLILELRCSQNVVHTFMIYSQAPIGLRKEKFGVEGAATHWEHGSMTSAEATRWTRWVVLKLLAQGLRLGTAHDVSWMSTVGLSGDETRSFFDLAQRLSARKFRLKEPPQSAGATLVGSAGEEQKFYEICEHVRAIGQRHRVFTR